MRLTKYSASGGCSCKIPLDVLTGILNRPLKSLDDAADFQVGQERLLLTVDFFYPMVDDPYVFGKIAASNAISDIFAMGGDPVCAVNILGTPQDNDFLLASSRIIKGAEELLKTEGVELSGGHTIRCDQLFYGLSVVGMIEKKSFRMDALKEGDMIVLTKKLGTGVITNAIKKGRIDENMAEDAILGMIRTNRVVKNILSFFNIDAATDVTGFGLLGHLYRMAEASGVECRVFLKNLIAYEHALELIGEGYFPGGSRRNIEAAKEFCLNLEANDPLCRLAADAQTSGGLLFGIKCELIEDVSNKLREDSIPFAVVGEVVKKSKNPKLLLEY